MPGRWAGGINVGTNSEHIVKKGVVSAQTAGSLIAVQAQIVADLPVQLGVILDNQDFEHVHFLPLFCEIIVTRDCCPFVQKLFENY